MGSMSKFGKRLFFSLMVLMLPAVAWATPITGTIFYTTFAGGTNVHRADVSYDGLGTFQITNNIGIAAVNGADGIAGNPNDPNSLFIGGQGPRIHRVSKTGPLLQTLNTPNSVFHLEVANSSTLYGMGIPSFGAFTRATINPDGSLSAPTAMNIVGGNGQITQIITTPSGDYYTASGPAGFGAFGTVSIVGTTATLSPFAGGPFPAAHGGTYDPFTNSIILFGDGRITQFDLAGAILSDLSFSGVGTFDQGTVDGLGHVFAANNGGTMTFIDYAATGLIGAPTNFISTQFLNFNLDDIAPLVGAGSTGGGGVPEPATALLLGAGLVGLGALRRRKAASD